MSSLQRCQEVKTNVYGDGCIAYMKEHGERHITYGDSDLWNEAYDYAITKGMKPLENDHPLNKVQRVMNALERDERFEKTYLNYHGLRGRSTRCFEIKEAFKTW